MVGYEYNFFYVSQLTVTHIVKFIKSEPPKNKGSVLTEPLSTFNKKLIMMASHFAFWLETG